MLKSLINSATWICIILLLVIPTNKTGNHSNISTIGSSSSYHCCINSCRQYCGQLSSFHYLLVSFTRIFQELISILLNETCIYDSLLETYGPEINHLKGAAECSNVLQKWQKSKIRNVSTCTVIIRNPIANRSYHYTNDDYRPGTKSLFAFNDTLQRLIKADGKHKLKLINYNWKRRTLCSVHDDEKYSKQILSQSNALNNNNNENAIKTLTDYNELRFINEIEDSDSLKPHVRVKRTGPEEEDSLSSLRYQKDYLKDLANSFPQNTYELMEENPYDDDASYDAKREIKSQEFSAINDQSSLSLDENDRSKIVDVPPLMISSFIKNDEPLESNSVGASSDIDKINSLTDNDPRYVERKSSEIIIPSQETSKDDSPIINRRSYDKNTEMQNLPDDPMLAVDLVRKKRNNYVGVYNKKNLEEINPFDPNKGQKLSSAIASLEADLLRLKRKTKNEKKSSTKKKKHTGKSHKSSPRSLGIVQSKNLNKLKTRARKSTEVGREDKSNVGFSKAVSKKDTYRSDSTESKNDRSLINFSTKDNVDNIKHSMVTREASMANGNKDDPTVENEKLGALLSNEKLTKVTKLREKRNKNTEAGHAFLSKEDELRYYESVREPEAHQCVNHNKKQRSVTNEVGNNRAVRSIEEVKELAKKLVTKVNELQNFINAEETRANEGREKRIGTRAIDDLCLNVSTGYDAFKETPKVVQKCVSSTNHKLSSPAKLLVQRKVDPSKITEGGKLVKGGKQHAAVEKKRSIVRRIGKTTPSNSRMNRRENEKPHRKWGKWTDWSSCSVTCGKGRQIRWRYCLRDCSTAETEMEEKTCQLPACPPGKFLGIF